MSIYRVWRLGSPRRCASAAGLPSTWRDLLGSICTSLLYTLVFAASHDHRRCRGPATGGPRLNPVVACFPADIHDGIIRAVR